jgi:hypothetical protein
MRAGHVATIYDPSLIAVVVAFLYLSVPLVMLTLFIALRAIGTLEAFSEAQFIRFTLCYLVPTGKAGLDQVSHKSTLFLYCSINMLLT